VPDRESEPSAPRIRRCTERGDLRLHRVQARSRVVSAVVEHHQDLVRNAGSAQGPVNGVNSAGDPRALIVRRDQHGQGAYGVLSHRVQFSSMISVRMASQSRVIIQPG
jgi:hypothetical protein